jgi:hypothetical protein
VAPSATPPASPVVPPTPQPEKVVDWADPKSGTHYLILSEKRSFNHAFLACENRGWSLFNPDVLDTGEWQRFQKSPIYDAIPWTVQFAGDPGEIRKAAFWTALNYTDSMSGSADAMTLTVRKILGTVETHRDQYSDDEKNGAHFTTICFFRGKTWFRCSAEQTCTHFTFTTTPGQPSYEVPEFTDNTQIEDSAETKDAVWQLLQKVGVGHSAPDALGAPWECKMDSMTFSCTQEH